MTEDKQEEKRQRIAEAALALLAEKGYRSTSMLQIAKRASVSNQTLYAWYGNKQGLFRSLIESNGEHVQGMLSRALTEQDDPLQTLAALGPLLLGFTTSESAIIVNRAAITDAGETGILGEAIESAARGEIVALTSSLMRRLIESRVFASETDPDDATETYISLLFGEVQIRQARGQLGPLDEAEISRRAERALALTCRLYGAG